ncbi:MAG: SDR family oxidoreductase [Acidobacteria bacterium]|jgi:3-oxoacyl-[acyl-carrier protein] reductase|nr:SDR family oxidoreductase [Acidobacteriota bacterium]
MNEKIVDQKLPNNLFSGKTAVVTGASRGIGRATALRFAEAGANVVVNYFQHKRDAEEVAHECENLGVRAAIVQADVSQLDDARRIVEIAESEFGRLDILVANAGIWEGGAVEAMPEEIWDKVLDANLKGTWTVCRAATKIFRKQNLGNIVIVSSTAGQRGEAGYSNYAASKGGQIAFTKALSNELAPTIRVNAVAPGWVDTNLNDSVFVDEDFVHRVVDAIPLQRVATADDVALSIIFLASDWSRHITGEILNINGGAVLCG